MGRKIQPDSFRLGQTEDWSSKWFYKKSKRYFLQEDTLIRKYLEEELSDAGLDSIEIERTRDDIKVSIKSSRPGLIIGRKGSRIESLRNELENEIKKLRDEKDQDPSFGLNLNVVELGRHEISASVMAQQIASDLERRMFYKRSMKRRLGSAEKNRDIEGAKIQVAGRLGGSEFSRTEWMDYGEMPLNTLRADIDFGEATAFTTYGTIGVKVWLYKGKVFDQENNKTAR